MKLKQDSRWPNAHIRLKKLYEARVRISQEEFGQEYGIGSQGMVWQYLNGYTPLNYDSAAKFSEGLRCTIEDISPEMDEALKRSILPALGLKKWRRAAALALVSLLAAVFSPSPEAFAQQGGVFSKSGGPVYYVKWLMLLCRAFRASMCSVANLLGSMSRFALQPDAKINTAA